MIEIWEPRYRDKSVLIATKRLTDGQDAQIEITKGYYKGKYNLPGDIIADCEVERKPVKCGAIMSFTIVPLDLLEKIEE